ncbi:metallophosphoesterase [Sphingopyxis kveilinensis]|uniref:metallophosphoesterase n=1 Tax=Sphingopyxis kveilinensis TaxID=3114367 RepID=UPI0030CD2A13
MRFFSRFRRGGSGPVTRRHRVPDGLLIYAIGDIHGRDDLFADILDRIDADRRSRPHDRSALVLLGDLVDRGPDSDRVVARAMTLSARFDNFHLLIGNHEECMLAALSGDVRSLRYFVRIGGDATVRSYLRDDARYDAASFEELADAFPAAVPQDHVDFLGSGEDWVTYGDYMFVHAGVRDNAPLDRQKTSDLRWIREEFLQSRAEREVIIVHGHTISSEVEEHSNRIGIDTGAYASGKLTALGLVGNERWFIQTAAA